MPQGGTQLCRELPWAQGCGAKGTELTQVHHQRCELITHPNVWKMHLRGALLQIKALGREREAVLIPPKDGCQKPQRCGVTAETRRHGVESRAGVLPESYLEVTPSGWKRARDGVKPFSSQREH